MFSVSTGYAGSKREDIYEIDDEDFDGLSEQEAESLIEDHYDKWLHEKINCSWSRIED
ncbi:DUF7167 family protein [Paenibacillus cremeus]